MDLGGDQGSILARHLDVWQLIKVSNDEMVVGAEMTDEVQQHAALGWKVHEAVCMQAKVCQRC